nr:hypothetical protein HK105_001203 [Polyrhizophydium stewartii]
MLDWFLSRRLLPAEVDSLSAGAREAIWAQALCSDWPGNLKTLPRLKALGTVPLAAVSRGMFDRLVALRAPMDAGVSMRLAVRYGWADVTQLADPGTLAAAAAREGAVPVLEEMHAARALGGPGGPQPHRLAELAASEGQLAAVQWLRGRTARSDWPAAAAMHAAARSGSLELVAWLLNTDGRSNAAGGIDAAAEHGHLHVVRHLADHVRGGECNVTAFTAAFVNGHINVLEFLRARFPQVYARAGDSAFKPVGHHASLQWLHQNRPHLVTAGLLPRFIDAGDAVAVSFLVEATGASIKPKMLQSALAANHAALVDWIVTHGRFQASRSIFDPPQQHGRNTDALAVLIAHDPRLAPYLADTFAAAGNNKLVEWLMVRFPGSVTQSTLEIAAARPDRAIVALIVTRCKGVEWDLVRARNIAAQNHAGARIMRLLGADSPGEVEATDLPNATEALRQEE